VSGVIKLITLYATFCRELECPSVAGDPEKGSLT